jgi:hypothetical protein
MTFEREKMQYIYITDARGLDLCRHLLQLDGVFRNLSPDPRGSEMRAPECLVAREPAKVVRILCRGSQPLVRAARRGVHRGLEPVVVVADAVVVIIEQRVRVQRVLLILQVVTVIVAAVQVNVVFAGPAAVSVMAAAGPVRRPVVAIGIIGISATRGKGRGKEKNNRI